MLYNRTRGPELIMFKYNLLVASNSLTIKGENLCLIWECGHIMFGGIL